VIRCRHGSQDLADAAEGFVPITSTPDFQPGAPSATTAKQWRDQVAADMHGQYVGYIAIRTAAEQAAEERDLARAATDSLHAGSIEGADIISPSFREAVMAAARLWHSTETNLL